MNSGHVGPWLRVGVPANQLSRWRHAAPQRPPSTKVRVAAPARNYVAALPGRRAHMARVRRYTRRRPYRRNLKARVTRTLQPFTFSRWLCSSAYLPINANAGALGLFKLNLNSVYDPFGDGSATIQPLGLEQYEGLYRRYTVVAWKAEFEVVSTDNTNPVVVGFTPLTTTTAGASFLHYREQPSTVQRTITPDIDRVYMKMKGKVKSWLLPEGGKLLTHPECSALVTASPSRILYGHLYAQAMDGSADPANAHIVVKLRQLVVFHDPVVPNRSTQ